MTLPNAAVRPLSRPAAHWSRNVGRSSRRRRRFRAASRTSTAGSATSSPGSPHARPSSSSRSARPDLRAGPGSSSCASCAASRAARRAGDAIGVGGDRLELAAHRAPAPPLDVVELGERAHGGRRPARPLGERASQRAYAGVHAVAELDEHARAASMTAWATASGSPTGPRTATSRHPLGEQRRPARVGDDRRGEHIAAEVSALRDDIGSVVEPGRAALAVHARIDGRIPDEVARNPRRPSNRARAGRRA